MTDRLQVDMIVKATMQGGGALKGTLTELNSAFGVMQKGMQAVGKAYDFLIADTVAYAKESKDLSMALGITTQETQKLIQVADDFGISQEALTGALEMAVKNGYQPSIENLAKLADETNAITDPIKRADKMVEIFGKGWTTLVPLLNAGGDAMRAGAKEAEAMGLVMSDEAMQGAEDLRKEIDNLEDRVTGFKTKLAGGLIPVLMKAADAFEIVAFGADTLGAAFTGSQEKMIDSLLAGKMTLADYNAGITGMGKAVMGWDKTLNAAFVSQNLMTQAQVDALKFTKALAGETDRAVNATQRWAAAQTAGGLSTEKVIPLTKEQTAGMRAYAEATQAGGQAQADFNKWLGEDAVASLKAYNDAAVASIKGTNDLAQALLGLGKASIAKAGIDALTAAMAADPAGRDAYEAQIRKISIAAGLSSKASYAAADGISMLDGLLLSKSITPEQYAISLGKMAAAARDGKVTLDEVGLALNLLPTSKDITLTVTTINKAAMQGGGTYMPAAPPASAPKHAAGLDMIVPPGYHENYPLGYASSGERVIVQNKTQQQQGSGGDNYTININDGRAMAMWIDELRRRGVDKVARTM